MFVIRNKSRQDLPVIVKVKGEEDTVHLTAYGEGSTVETDELTEQANNLLERKLISVDEKNSQESSQNQSFNRQVVAEEKPSTTEN